MVPHLECDTFRIFHEYGLRAKKQNYTDLTQRGWIQNCEKDMHATYEKSSNLQMRVYFPW